MLVSYSSTRASVIKMKPEAFIQYLLVSIRSSTGSLCLLPNLPIHHIFPSVPCFGRQ